MTLYSEDSELLCNSLPQSKLKVKLIHPKEPAKYCRDIAVLLAFAPAK